MVVDGGEGGLLHPERRLCVLVLRVLAVRLELALLSVLSLALDRSVGGHGGIALHLRLRCLERMLERSARHGVLVVLGTLASGRVLRRDVLPAIERLLLNHLNHSLRSILLVTRLLLLDMRSSGLFDTLLVLFMLHALHGLLRNGMGQVFTGLQVCIVQEVLVAFVHIRTASSLALRIRNVVGIVNGRAVRLVLIHGGDTRVLCFAVALLHLNQLVACFLFLALDSDLFSLFGGRVAGVGYDLALDLVVFLLHCLQIPYQFVELPLHVFHNVHLQVFLHLIHSHIRDTLGSLENSAIPLTLIPSSFPFLLSHR